MTEDPSFALPIPRGSDNRFRKSVLAPIAPESMQRMEALLSGDYLTTFVHEFDQAVKRLTVDDYDLIICGAHFDNSRSIELLQAARTIQKSSSTPFIVIRLISTDLTPAITSGINLAVQELGTAAYLDLTGLLLHPAEMKRLLDFTTEALMKATSTLPNRM